MVVLTGLPLSWGLVVRIHALLRWLLDRLKPWLVETVWVIPIDATVIELPAVPPWNSSEKIISEWLRFARLDEFFPKSLVVSDAKDPRPLPHRGNLPTQSLLANPHKRLFQSQLRQDLAVFIEPEFDPFDRLIVAEGWSHPTIEGRRVPVPRPVGERGIRLVRGEFLNPLTPTASGRRWGSGFLIVPIKSWRARNWLDLGWLDPGRLFRAMGDLR